MHVLDPSDARRIRALELIEDAYESAGQMSRLNLKSINRGRDPSSRYHSVNELVREQTAIAGALATFAVNLRLITPQDALQKLLEFSARYPGSSDELSEGPGISESP